jgi:hypothetical protein
MSSISMTTSIGFYNTRVYAILMNYQVPLSSREVWDIFKARYNEDIKAFKGKTKKSTIDALLSKCAKNRVLKRHISGDNKYKYYLPEARHQKYVNTETSCTSDITPLESLVAASLLMFSIDPFILETV